MRALSENVLLRSSLKGRAMLAAQGLALLLLALALSGCGAVNLGKWKGFESTSSDEQYYLLKDVFLTGGSSVAHRDAFDHNLHEVVNLYFTPRNEKNTYVAESKWVDPNGLEFRTIRTTHDKKKEGKTGEERSTTGSTTRVHTMPTAELFNHKPGIWKVSLYLDGKLARRLTFTLR